jgi:sensor domain CHASE-containing protein
MRFSTMIAVTVFFVIIGYFVLAAAMKSMDAARASENKTLVEALQ